MRERVRVRKRTLVQAALHRPKFTRSPINAAVLLPVLLGHMIALWRSPTGLQFFGQWVRGTDGIIDAIIFDHYKPLVIGDNCPQAPAAASGQYESARKHLDWRLLIVLLLRTPSRVEGAGFSSHRRRLEVIAHSRLHALASLKGRPETLGGHCDDGAK